MKLKLGTNLGFAANRYPEPEVWGRIVGQTLGLRYAQFTADLCSPWNPDDYIDAYLGRVLRMMDKYDFKIDGVFTSTYTRLNWLAHPDARSREIASNWFKKFLKMGKRLGAKNAGSHFGIMSFDTYDDPAKREAITEAAIKGWQELTFFAQELGYECLIFEPMSVPREYANTTDGAKYLMDRVNERCGVPMRLCLDVGHAPDPSERDPYPWLEKLGAWSPVVHLQQTVLHRSTHQPFTEEANKTGIIKGERVLECLGRSGAQEALLAFEIAHREHHDTDTSVVEDHVASVEYWRQFVKD